MNPQKLPANKSYLVIKKARRIILGPFQGLNNFKNPRQK